MKNESHDAGARITWWQEHSPKMDFDSLKKVNDLRGIFDKLEAEKRIGKNIADIGCGTIPLSKTLLHQHADRKIVQVDVADVGQDGRNQRFIKYNVDDITKPGTFSTKKALIKAADHFGVDPRLGKTAHLDTMLFSEILNYVDYQAVLQNLSTYLKPGGRFIILNMPDRHPPNKRDLLHPKGAHSNFELEQFLKKDFEIEDVIFPWGREEDLAKVPGEDFSMMLLIARKK